MHDAESPVDDCWAGIFINMIIAGIAGLPSVVQPEDMPMARWPHTIAIGEVTVALYPPQATTWKEYRSLEARVAVEVMGEGWRKSVLGTRVVTVDTQTDFDGASRLRIFRGRFLALLGCMLVSCATIDATVTQYAGAPRFPPSNPSAVEILRTEPMRPHERLGEVDASTQPAPPIEEVENKLRSEAAKLGADAVVVVVDHLQPVGAFVSGPWFGRDVDVIKGRKVVGVAIKYRP